MVGEVKMFKSEFLTTPFISRQAALKAELCFFLSRQEELCNKIESSLSRQVAGWDKEKEGLLDILNREKDLVSLADSVGEAIKQIFGEMKNEGKEEEGVF